MRRKSGVVVFGLLFLTAALSSTTEAPSVISPTSKWHVLEDKITCNATRLYGEGQDSAIVIEASPAYHSMKLTVTFPQREALSSAVRASVAFDDGPSLPLRPSTQLISDKHSVIQGFMLTSDQMDSLAKAKIARFELRNQTTSFELADMAALLAEFNRCRRNLFVAWGMDPDAEKRIATHAVPTTPWPFWDFGTDKGKVVIVVQVETNGRVTDCRSVVTSGRAKFDAAVCKLAKGVHYKPAIDVDGRPISTPEIVQFSYEVGAPVTIFVNQ